MLIKWHSDCKIGWFSTIASAAPPPSSSLLLDLQACCKASNESRQSEGVEAERRRSMRSSILGAVMVLEFGVFALFTYSV